MGSLFQVAFVALIFAWSAAKLLQLLHLLRLAAFALLYVSSLRAAYEGSRRAAAGPRGTGAGRCWSGTGAHIADVAHALGDGPTAPSEVVGYISLEAAGGERAALAGHAQRTSTR